MVSNASDDLPEPDNPVNTMSLLRGSSRLTLRRLCSRAPRITRESATADQATVAAQTGNACSLCRRNGHRGALLRRRGEGAGDAVSPQRLLVRHGRPDPHAAHDVDELPVHGHAGVVARLAPAGPGGVRGGQLRLWHPPRPAGGP